MADTVIDATCTEHSSEKGKWRFTIKKTYPLFTANIKHTTAMKIPTAYFLDDEPMAGPQRRLRLCIMKQYARMLELLKAKNSRGECWAHDFMSDDYTHVNYENLGEALESNTFVNLDEAVPMMIELLEAFEPDFSFEEYDIRDCMYVRKYERSERKCAEMVAERDSILADLSRCKAQMKNIV